ncbi:hypothetical protein RUM8411_00221 [Ruegeria meonggei]|uniref:Uncharacterized protein n=1 Tax=Ruegeria meonggei TaxID=1446476 RepID=A0A1X6Y6K7_9RHOB|nr:hypothetical protein RUM8411_00221 [Ruegeria meonggei]
MKGRPMKTSRVSLISLLACACCVGPVPDLTRVEAIDLLNSGQVESIGVTQAGWTVLTLTDGAQRHNRSDVIGYPRQLLAKCDNCSDVSFWLE